MGLEGLGTKNDCAGEASSNLPETETSNGINPVLLARSFENL
jgi:hypothetical protein